MSLAYKNSSEVKELYERGNLKEKTYWAKFNKVIVAIYKHGTDLMEYWVVSADVDSLSIFPEHIFNSATDRLSNIVKVICPEGTERAINSWKKHLKMSLEIHTYSPVESIEVLFVPTNRKLKFAGKVSQIEIEEKPQKIKALIVDDSKVIRSLLKDALQKQTNFEVVAETGAPEEVSDLLKKYNPDVMTLDINMPNMNGVELIKKIGRDKLPPTVVVSSLNMNEGTLVMQALENGAFDYIQKPSMEERAEFSKHLVEKLVLAAESRAQMQKRIVTGPSLRKAILKTEGLIVIGASTGGTEAVKAILRHLPKNIPPILIVQHIPPIFSKAFADSLNSMCEFEVREAKDGDKLLPGHAYVAPGGLQMGLKSEGRNHYSLSIVSGDKVSGHCPSVDYLFNSVANTYHGEAMALLLTGMGADGAKGLLNLKQKKFYTVAQNEETCVVFGMPKQAIKLNAVEKVVGLHEMAHEIATYFRS